MTKIKLNKALFERLATAGETGAANAIAQLFEERAPAARDGKITNADELVVVASMASTMTAVALLDVLAEAGLVEVETDPSLVV